MKLVGSWINQNGSRLEITFDSEGSIRGKFVSAKGRAAREKEYSVTGVRNDNLVSFIVSFETAERNLHSISTFAGRIVPGTPAKIHTVWLLGREFEDAEQTKPTETWNTFTTNSDVFVFQPENDD